MLVVVLENNRIAVVEEEKGKKSDPHQCAQSASQESVDGTKTIRFLQWLKGVAGNK